MSKTEIIYEPRGRAAEYSELAANLYHGCGHQCVYCYAPDATKTTRLEFANSKPRKNIIDKLQLDAAKMSFPWNKETRPIQFSFTTDPYQPLDERIRLTRAGIEVLKHYGLRVSILTKGGLRATRDFDLLDENDLYGVTMTLLDARESSIWEPYAAPPSERIESLRQAHEKGIPTWVSLEPVIYPEVSLEIIRQTHSFVDEYKVGTLNYHERAKQIDWANFARNARDLLNSLNCRYYLKADLRRWLPAAV